MFTIRRPPDMDPYEFLENMRGLRILLYTTAAYVAGLCVAVIITHLF